jgi:MSHA biogenesis protein MshI
MRLWPGFGSASVGWTALDCGTEGIFAASVKNPASSAGKPQVIRIGEAEQRELDVDALTHLSKKFSATGFRWTLPLNRGDYNLLVVAQPTVEAAEMRQSLRWSIGSMVDYPIDEAVIDWMAIPTINYLPLRAQHVYAVAAKKEIVSRYTTTFERAGLELGAIDIRETAQRNISALMEHNGEALGMLSVDVRGVQITVTYEGELYLDRFMDWSLDTALTGDSESRRKHFERVSLQVQRSLDFVRRTLPFLNISRILIAPLPAPIALREAIAEATGERVDQLDLANVFDISLVPELREAEVQARYFVALGAALRGKAQSK